jgi:hypothetical protein
VGSLEASEINNHGGYRGQTIGNKLRCRLAAQLVLIGNSGSPEKPLDKRKKLLADVRYQESLATLLKAGRAMT